MRKNIKDVSWGSGMLALSPILVFLVLYLVTSIVIGDFYKMPLSIAMLVATIWSAFTLKGRSLSERIEIFSKGASASNIMYMVWIFILAGAFASVAKLTGAVDATVSVALDLLPPSLLVPGLFITTCFISMSIGTSVGTVVALTPLAVEMANSAGASVPYFVAIVLGGAFFGDNLSFISDTTIAATRTQGCNMKDKFFANIRIVVPAAIIALILYCVNSPALTVSYYSDNSSPWLMIPYLIVIVLAVFGLNVIVVLLVGIISACIGGLIKGIDIISLCTSGGEGIDSVGNLIIITLLASGMLSMIKEAGGIDFLLNVLNKKMKNSKTAQFGIVFLVSVVNLCTANNTVAIITVGSMVKKISSNYNISPRRSASLLDTGACITQALIPYGAQGLMASALAGISPAQPWLYLYYPQILILTLVISIFLSSRSEKNRRALD